MKKISLILFTLIFLSHAQAAFHSNNSNGHVTFEAVGKPAMIKIKGESPAPKSTMTFVADKVSLESELDLDQLKTGIEMRDDHMKNKYLETKKFPKAKLVINSLKVPVSWEQTPTSINDQEFEGILNLHGKDMPIKGTFRLNEKREATAEFKIKLTDFGIEIPDYLGIKVAELVNVKTQIQFEKQ